LNHRLISSVIDKAAGQATEGAEPLGGNRYKLALVKGAVAEALSSLKIKLES
jgi:hypothetical protein